MKQACIITLSESERLVLLEIIKGHTSQRNHIQRARIILACAQGFSNTMIGVEFEVHKLTAGKWRRRWYESKIALDAIQSGQDKSMTLKQKVLLVLSDAPRSGSPTKFTADQLCQIYAVATEKPDECGVPLSHWSLESLAAELVKRNIVNSISTSQLNAFLKSRVA